nr:DUF3237 domain-containing protein [Pseudomonadota bacterium]
MPRRAFPNAALCASYFRIAPLFETAATRYTWLNNIVAVGTGHRRADGPIYGVFEVL